MKLTTLSSALAALALSFSASTASALQVSSNSNATQLANTLAGTGVSISNATLSTASSTAAGTFTGAAAAIGFDNGVLLTTGTVNCAPGPNNQVGCSDSSGNTTSLKFDFTSDTGNIFFNYVFASEEYNEYVGSNFNDLFELKLNGVNIAILPGNAGVVSINNVNNTHNSAYYRDNAVLHLDTQYDGLTTMLTSSATGLKGINHFEFLIKDQGDDSLDSGVFIQAGTFSSTTKVPEPGSLALLGLGLMALLTYGRKKA
jgi:hypothetical protein